MTDDVTFRPAIPPEDESARWPGTHPGTTVFKAGSVTAPGRRRIEVDTRVQRDITLQMRDGTTIRTDVITPDGAGPLPAILAWSPYGKRGGFWGYDKFPNHADVPASVTSGLDKWEAPDPAFWCPAGYAVVNPDIRGSFDSEGDVQFWNSQEGRDGFDMVEWIAAQPWCDGHVVMAGNSWLAVGQWLTAANHPPHLRAIAPWEGMTDVYRDLIAHGGIPYKNFPEQLVTHNYGRGGVEDIVAMVDSHPLMDDYWRDHICDIDAIDVPAYVVGSWTGSLHVRGTLDAFRRLNPSRTWLRVHNTQEWNDQFAHEEDLRRFFDYVVKGVDNGWQDTPRVRLSVLDPGGEDTVDRPMTDYPVPEAKAWALHLDAGTLQLENDKPSEGSTASYPAPDGILVFSLRVEEDLELIGPMSLRLFVSTDRGDDLDVFTYVRKANASGLVLPTMFFSTVPTPGGGAKGKLRASHRALDTARSTDLEPVHLHTAQDPLGPDEVVQLDIPIWPIGIRFHAGEQLQVVVSAHDLAIPYHPDEPTNETQLPATLTLHTGGEHGSVLLVPRMPG